MKLRQWTFAPSILFEAGGSPLLEIDGKANQTVFFPMNFTAHQSLISSWGVHVQKPWFISIFWWLQSHFLNVSSKSTKGQQILLVSKWNGTDAGEILLTNIKKSHLSEYTLEKPIILDFEIFSSNEMCFMPTGPWRFMALPPGDSSEQQRWLTPGDMVLLPNWHKCKGIVFRDCRNLTTI